MISCRCFLSYLFVLALPLGNAVVFAEPEIEEVGGAADKTATDGKSSGDTSADGKTDPFDKGTAQTINPDETESSAEMKLNDVGAIELHTSNTDLRQVLSMLSRQTKTNIVPSKSVSGTVSVDLYGVTVREALTAILKGNDCVWIEEGNFIHVYTAKEAADIAKAARKQVSAVLRVHYTPVDNAVAMIRPALSAEAKVAFTVPPIKGIESGGDIGGNSHASDDMIIVTDYQENIDAARKILKQVDQRPAQVLMEATILRATLNDDNALGIDFTVMAGIDFAGLNTQGLSPDSVIGGSAINSGGQVTDDGAAGFSTNLAAGVAGDGLKIGVVTNSIGVFLEALEEVSDVTVLANPKILALNKQKGEVLVGRQDGFITTETTATSEVQTIDFIETGTRLIFRPYIGNDGYIRIEIHPEDSSGGLNSSNLPFKVTTEITTNILVRDGNTVVIGGLFRDDTSISRAQVPGLGNIPFAGALFRRQSDRIQREEVVILLTPHILRDAKSANNAAMDVLADINRIRLGLRRGMMFTSRQRLSDIWFEMARREMTREGGNQDAAIFYLTLASNLSPLNVEAARLKQNLTGKKLTEPESLSRDFIRTRLAKRLDCNGGKAVNGFQLNGQHSTTGAAPSAPASQPATSQPADATTKPASTQPAAATKSPAQSKPEKTATTQPIAKSAATTQPIVSEATSEAMAAVPPKRNPSPAPKLTYHKMPVPSAPNNPLAKRATTQPSAAQSYEGLQRAAAYVLFKISVCFDPSQFEIDGVFNSVAVVANAAVANAATEVETIEPEIVEIEVIPAGE